MSNIMAAVAYLFGWVSGLIVYFISKDDKVARFHGMQAILANIVYSIVYFIIAMIGLVIFFVLGMMNNSMLALVGTGIAVILVAVPGLLVLLIMLWAMWQAFNDKMYKLPLIGNFAEKWSS